MQWKGFRFPAGISHDLNSSYSVKPAFLTSNSVDHFSQFSVIVDPITRKWAGVFLNSPPLREEKPIFARKCASLNWNQIFRSGSLSPLPLAQNFPFSPLKASSAEEASSYLEDDFACPRPRNSIKRRAGSIKGAWKVGRKTLFHGCWAKDNSYCNFLQFSFIPCCHVTVGQNTQEYRLLVRSLICLHHSFICPLAHSRACGTTND